jgi:hypothetical protein
VNQLKQNLWDRHWVFSVPVCRALEVLLGIIGLNASEPWLLHVTRSLHDPGVTASLRREESQS